MSAASDRTLRVVADDRVADVEAAFAGFGTLTTQPGASIGPASLAGADALVVRSVTRVDAALVGGSSLGFVGTATAGRDHLDEPALAARGIATASAPGSNAWAVADYVLAGLAIASAHRGERWPAPGPVGVVGFGCVGRRVTARLRALGVEVLVCDPPLAADPRPPAREPDPELAALVPGERFVGLDTLLPAASVLTVHVPRVAAGPHPTVGLVDGNALARLPHRALVVHTSRGGVVDDAALLRWLGAGQGDAIVDVWASEPDPPPAELVARTLVATPHVAGYSAAGKRAATVAIHRALAAWAGREPWLADEDAVARRVHPGSLRDGSPEALAAFVAEAVDLRTVDHALRKLVAAPDPDAAGFEGLRRAYALRPELRELVATAPTEAHAALRALGVEPRARPGPAAGSLG